MMETQYQAHPSRLHLAALALGKVKPERQGELQEHVASCPVCSDFLSNTPRDTLVSLLREARSQTSASDQSTPGIRDAGTIVAIPSAIPPDATPLSAPADPAPRPPQHSPNGEDPPDETPVRPLADEEIPQELREQSKYRIIRLLGRGGMGSVYEAHHDDLDRRVAIKTVNPGLLAHPDALKRFDQEVKVAARLDHINVARTYDAQKFGSLRVLVTEFLSGQSLDRFLASRGRLEVFEVCRLIRQAMMGLQHVHERGMVHRDLKPQNLMLTLDGKVKILDFGLARVASERRAGDGLTRENALMGTPHYLAPEQALNAAKADIRADIYSLGCTLYCLFTGQPPFNGETEMQVLLAHQNETPRPLSQVRPDVPRALSDLVDRMLAKNPADRPQTPADVTRALTPYVKGPGTGVAPAPEPSAADPVTTLLEQPNQPADLPVHQKTHPLEFLKDETDAIAPAVSHRVRRQSPAAKLHALLQNPPGGVWFWAGSVVAALLPLFFFAWVMGAFSVNTPDGSIVVDGVSPDAEVRVDGRKVTLKLNGEELTITAVTMGPHKLELVSDGKTIGTSDVTIEFAGQPVHARFEALAPNTARAPDAMSREAQIFAGEWKIEDQELVQTLSTDCASNLVFGDPTWTRYILSFQAQSANGSPWINICWHYKDLDNFCGVSLRDSFDSANSISDGKWGLETRNQTGSLQPKKWHDVRVEIQGPKFKCFVNNQQVLESDLKRPSKGRISLGTNNNEVKFRKIRVVSEDGKAVLWEGNPKLPPLGQIPVLAKAPPQEKPHRTVDLMPFVDAQKDAIQGTWTKVRTGIKSDNSWPARLRIPYQPPEEYNFRMVFTRMEGQNDVAQIISHDGHNCSFAMGAIDNTTGGFGLIGGKWVQDNPTKIWANGFLRNGRKYTAVVYVRKGLLAASIDGNLVREFKTNYSDVSLEETSVGNNVLGVFTAASPTVIHALEIEEITGNGRKVDLAPAGDVSSLPKATPNQEPLRNVDLMQYIDASQDAVDGVWKKEGAELSCKGWRDRLRIPYQPPEEYDLLTEFTRTGGHNEVSQFLSQGKHHFCFTLGDGNNTEGGFRQISGEGPHAFHSPEILRNGRRYQAVVHVRKNWIGASVDGKLVAGHSTKDFSEISVAGDWRIGEALLGVGSWESPVTFHKIEIAEITGQGKPLREIGDKAAAAPAPPQGKPQSAVEPIMPAAARERFPSGQIFGDSTWRVGDDGDLVKTGGLRSSFILFGDPAWSAYNVDFNVQTTTDLEQQRCAFSFQFHAEHAKNFRYLAAGYGKGHQWNTLVGVFGGRFSGERRANNKDFTIQPNRWYHVRMEIRGANAKYIVDGKNLLENTDDRLTRGRIGLGSHGGDVRFRHIRVTDENGKEIWKGAPNLPARDASSPDSESDASKTSPDDELFSEQSIVPHEEVIEPLAHAAAKREPIDLLAKVRLPEDGVTGKWTRTDAGIQTNDERVAKLRLCQWPDGEYDFRISFTRISGDKSIAQILHYDGASFAWMMGKRGNKVCGFDQVNHEPLQSDKNKSTIHIEAVLTNGKRHTAVVKVRKDSVSAYLDDKLVSKLLTNYSDLTLLGRWSVGQDYLGIVTESPFLIHSAELIPVAEKTDTKPAAK